MNEELNRRGGDNYDQEYNKNRHNGHYNGFQNYSYLVIGYEAKL